MYPRQSFLYKLNGNTFKGTFIAVIPGLSPYCYEHHIPTVPELHTKYCLTPVSKYRTSGYGTSVAASGRYTMYGALYAERNKTSTDRFMWFLILAMLCISSIRNPRDCGCQLSASIVRSYSYRCNFY